MAQKNIEKLLKDLVNNLLDQLGITPQKLVISQDETKAFNLRLQLDDQDTGLLIGYHGDTIAALQLILGLILYQQTGQWHKLVLDIGDYRQKRSQSLEQMADETIERVVSTGQPIALFNLNPFERRVIHLYVENNSQVVSQSDGEGKNRHLIISLKDQSTELDSLPAEAGSSVSDTPK